MKIQDVMDVAKIRVQKIIRQGRAAALRVITAGTQTMAKADTVKTETEATATVRTAEGEATVKAEKTVEIMAESMTRTPIAEARAMVEAGKTDHQRHRLHQSRQAVTTGEAEDAVARQDHGRMAINLHLFFATYTARPCRLTTQGTTSTAIRKHCKTTMGQSVLVQRSGLLRRRHDFKSASTSSAMTEQKSQICGWRITTRR